MAGREVLYAAVSVVDLIQRGPTGDQIVVAQVGVVRKVLMQFQRHSHARGLIEGKTRQHQ